MPFDTLKPRLRQVAESSLRYCVQRYGRNRLQIEVEIDKAISWAPTFHLRTNKPLIVATEVSDVLYPHILKIAAHDILKCNYPIAVYLACPLEVYLADTSQQSVNLLRRDGFGLITVDDQGRAVVQQSSIALAQHISDRDLDAAIRDLTPKLKVAFRSSHATFLVNEGQGLQQAGQIVEAIVGCMAKESAAKGYVPVGTDKRKASEMIDELYLSPDWRDHRAALGGARNFIKEYRNIASHPARTAIQAIEKIQKCKQGLLDAIRISGELKDAMRQKGLKISIHIA